MRVTKKQLLSWLPLLIIVILLSISFFYGWYVDSSKPQGGIGWADQSLYIGSAHRLASGGLPLPGQLHYAVGYPMLGAPGALLNASDPFVVVSYALLIGSAVFAFLGAKRVLGTGWALFFTALLFVWDGVGRSFQFSSDLFAVPWNNQVLFFTFSFYFWLFATQINKRPSWRLITIMATISGLCFLTREETIVFILPVLFAYFYMTKTDWKKVITAMLIVGLCFLPQLVIKANVLGSATASGRKFTYGQVKNQYLSHTRLYRNTWETIINSKHFNGPEPQREALFQAAPWLWLSLVGMPVILISKKYPSGIKVFMVASFGLIVFYLAGANMSAHKLKFHCLRYISPGLVALNFASVVAVKEGWEKGRDKLSPTKARIKK